VKDTGIGIPKSE